MDPKKDIFATSKGKWDFTIAIIVIVIFSIFIYQLIPQAEEEKEQNDLVLENEVTKNEGSKTKDSISLDAKIYRPIEIQMEDSYEDKKGNAIVIADFQPLKKAVEKDSIITIPQKENIVHEPAPIPEEKLKKGVDSIPVITETQEPTPITEEVEHIKTESEKAIKNETVKTTNTENSDCIVIVGVFKNPNNKKSVIQKLKSLGYTYSEGILSAGKNYVGVPVVCGEEEKNKELLKELNHIFRIKSWIKKE